ncbi:CPBP family glutamic-type intramembrane protease [Arthrobacter sp. 2MCAF14]
MSVQSLFIANIPYLTYLLTSGSPVHNFICFTLIMLTLTGGAAWIYQLKVADYRFLRADARIGVFYVIPVGLLIHMLTHAESFSVPSPLYAAGMVFSAFAQDVVTFGFLHSHFESLLGRTVAGVAVAGVFWAAHLPFVHSAQMALVYALGFALMSFLRFRTRSIYAANIVHVSFLLLG